MSLNRRNALRSAFWESAVLHLCFTVYFYNRRSLTRVSLLYCRSVVPKSLCMLHKLTTAARHSKQPTHVKAGPSQARRTGLRISQVNYQQSRGNETQKLKMGRGANCLWSLNISLFIKGFTSICIFSPLLWKACSTWKESGSVPGPLWIWIELCFFKASFLGELVSSKVRNTFEFKKENNTLRR